MKEKYDFFISCSHIDNKWAEWIVNCLEQEGFTTFWGTRDLKVGENFVLVIQEYLEKADKLIAILSPSFLSSSYCQAEVSAMRVKGENNIIPIKVADVQLKGELANILYIDLCNVSEAEAKKRLINNIVFHKKNNDNSLKFSENKKERKRDNGERFPGKLPMNNLQFLDEGIIVGGEEKINAIRQAFNSSNVVSSNLTLSGLGGSGKTVIAKGYIRQFGYLYDLIWWIPAYSYESILGAYNEFILKNGLALEKPEQNKTIEIVKQWMEETTNWLFVFDDVIDFSIIQQCIPAEHNGNILLTSRKSIWNGNNINEISVNIFTMEMAMRFLKLRGVSGTKEDLHKLIEVSGYLPATLEMAARYILDNKMTVKQFLEFGYSIHVEKDKSFKTYSNIASIYREQGDFDNALNFYKKALAVCKQINGEASNEVIDIYNNIATVYQGMDRVDKALEIYCTVIEMNDERLKDNSPNMATTYSNIATIYRQRREYDKALKLYHKALMILKEIFKEGHPSIAATYSNIAFVYRKLERYAEALEYNYQALIINEKILGSEHPDTAALYNNIAEIYDLQGKYEEALSLYKRALEVYEAVMGEEHSVIANIYNKIAFIYQKRANYETSLSFYKKAMEIQQKTDFLSRNEVISNNINIINSRNTMTNITNLSEKIPSSDKSRETIELKAIEVLELLKQQNEDDYTLFNRNFSELIRFIRTIKKELVYNNDTGTDICHYSKLSTLKFIIKEEKKVPRPRFRISNIAYLNDPSEGNVIFQVLKKYSKSNVLNVLFGTVNDENKLSQVPFSNVFIGSFSTAKNKLPMWTLYGDDSKGCCLVFDDNFFDKENIIVEEKTKEERILSQDLTLYRVKYVDIDNINESDIIIDYLRNVTRLLDEIENIIAKYEFVKMWILSLLDEIRFLFKDCDYDYENEVRIIIYAEESEIKVDDGTNALNIPKLYVDIQRKLLYKEIILGSKIDKPMEVAPFLLHSGMVKKVLKSGIQYQ